MKSFLLLITLIYCLPIFAQEQNYTISKMVTLKIDASINPATLSYLESGLKEAKSSNSALLMKINTPGGLVSTTKSILTKVGEAKIPFIVWVTPEGASATSAGAIIASGAHQLFMQPGTNIGAATPITMGEELPKDARKKAINDIVALVESLREARGKNTKAFKEMVSEAKSFKSKEAEKKKIIDGIASNRQELIELINKTPIILDGKKMKLIINNATEFKEIEMDLGQKFLNIFSNPSLAYLLFLIGAALIYLELQAPGGFIAGSVGAFSLILAGISFQVLPLNLGALALMGLSFILFILEVYITSFGLLTIAGLVSLVVGSLFLFRTDDAYITISQSVIFSSIGAITVFVGIIVYFILKNKKRTQKNFVDIQMSTGKVLSEMESTDGKFIYQVLVNGERWKAVANQQFEVDEEVEISGQEGLELTITKKGN